MKFTAHIGLGKTGSSAIQKSLQSYEGSLNSAENWGWPKLVNDEKISHKWLCSQHSNEKTKALYDTIVAHSKKTGCDHIIWSNEAIVSNPKMLELFKELREWDDNLEVRIIVYVREPGKWLKSAWDQWGLIDKILPSIRRTWGRPGKWNGHRPPCFSNWFSKWGRGQYNSYLKWKDIAEIRRYQEGKDVIDDFSEVIGIDLPRVREYETLTSSEVLSRAVYNNTYTQPVSTKKFDLYESYFCDGANINDYAKRFFALPDIKKKMQVLLNNADDGLFKDADLPQERTITPEDYSRLLDQAIIFSIEAIGRIDQLEDAVEELSKQLHDGT